MGKSFRKINLDALSLLRDQAYPLRKAIFILYCLSSQNSYTPLFKSSTYCRCHAVDELNTADQDEIIAECIFGVSGLSLWGSSSRNSTVFSKFASRFSASSVTRTLERTDIKA